MKEPIKGSVQFTYGDYSRAVKRDIDDPVQNLRVSQFKLPRLKKLDNGVCSCKYETTIVYATGRREAQPTKIVPATNAMKMAGYTKGGWESKQNQAISF